MDENTVKCEVCGVSVLSDAEQFVVCNDCRTALHSDIEEVGDDNGDS